VFIGLTVTIFVLFALLRDGEQFVTWLRAVAPVSEDVQQELMAELDDLMWASIVGNAAVAGIQAILLGAGLVLVGMPGAVFLTVATFVLCLLPLVGAFGVWVPVSIYLLGIGRPMPALIIFVIGSLVSASDSYLRPAIINRSGALNVAVITVGIFGGIIVFGVVGLFIGPVVLGGTKLVLDQFARERAESTTG
jgi:predicted PurR-regulated permease PerM